MIRFFRPRLHPMPLLVGAFVILAGVYAWATPIFEASDELWHFGMVAFIVDEGRLPVQRPGVETQYRQEGSQPPLYYMLSALMVRSIDRSDFEALSEMNPHAQVGIPGAVGNKNIVLHDTLYPAPVNTALAVYLLRASSVGLGVVTVVAVYFAGRELAGDSVGLVAAGITAFNPMFLFITASVNNDNLVTALNSIAIWQTLILLRRGFAPWHSALIAIVVALASLSKLSGNVVVPIIAVSAFIVALRTRDWTGFVFLGVLMAGVWASLSGWWYVRNIRLYGELFGTAMMVQVAGPRLEPLTLRTLIDEFEGFRVAYWGLFGGVNVLTFRWFYLVMDTVTSVALMGIVIGTFRAEKVRREKIAVLGTLVLVGFGSLIAWTAQTYASQGRLLFPFVAAIHPMLAFGLIAVLRGRITRLMLAALALFALVVPVASIVPTYASPTPLETLPRTVIEVYARYDDIELVGYQVEDRRYAPGDDLPVTVYWHAAEPSSRDLSAFLTVVSPAGDVVGKVDTYPGAGRLRTSTWEGLYADSYVLHLDEDTNGRFDLRLQVGWWHFPTESIIVPTDADGNLLDSVLLDAGGFAGKSLLTEPFTEVEPARFGGAIELTGYRYDDAQLALRWTAIDTLEEDYTVFVQWLDDKNDVVSQGDAPPPLSTRYWRAGDVAESVHHLPLPQVTGNYHLVVGWYHPADFARLPTLSPGDAFTLFDRTVD